MWIGNCLDANCRGLISFANPRVISIAVSIASSVIDRIVLLLRVFIAGGDVLPSMTMCTGTLGDGARAVTLGDGALSATLGDGAGLLVGVLVGAKRGDRREVVLVDHVLNCSSVGSLVGSRRGDLRRLAMLRCASDGGGSVDCRKLLVMIAAMRLRSS